MILTNSNGEAIATGTISSSNMEVDMDSPEILMAMLGENMYKDGIGSTVREWTSNALDSHVEAGVDEPVIVGLERDENGIVWFKVEDKGVGISPDRQENVIKKYAASTKRERNDLLGAYGLGMKSGLAYADSFIYTTRYDGVEYQYIMYKGEDTNKIDLIYKKETTERNGTIFQIQVSTMDRLEFVEKMAQQLCYFEKVYFKTGGYVDGYISNDFKILKTEEWKMSQLNTDEDLHLCLDNVYYPLDFQKLGIPRIKVALGLNFKIGEGISPIPSREDIKYTPQSKKLIVERIDKVMKDLVIKYNKTITNIKNFYDIYPIMQNRYYIIEGFTINMQEVAKNAGMVLDVPKMEGIEKLDLTYLYNARYGIFNNYEVRGRISFNKFLGKFSTGMGDLAYETSKKCDYMIATQRPKGVMRDYLKDVYKTVTFLYKKEDKKLGERKKLWGISDKSYDYIPLLGLRSRAKEDWRQIIKEFQIIEKSVLDKIPRLDDIQPSKEWLEERKANRRKGNRIQIDKVEINPQWAEYSNRSDRNATFKSAVIALDKARVYKKLVVYGKEEDKNRLDEVFLMGRKNFRVECVLVGARDYSRLEKSNFHNWINIHTFMEGKTKPFKVYCESFYIKRMEDKHRWIFDRPHTKFLHSVNSNFASQLEELVKYRENNIGYGICEVVATSIMEYAEQNKIYDEEIHYKVLEVEKELENYYFMETINHEGKHVQNAIKIAVDILKYRKRKVNLEHYHKPEPLVIPQMDKPADWEPDDETEEEVMPELEEVDDITIEC